MPDPQQPRYAGGRHHGAIVSPSEPVYSSVRGAPAKDTSQSAHLVGKPSRITTIVTLSRVIVGASSCRSRSTTPRPAVSFAHGNVIEPISARYHKTVRDPSPTGQAVRKHLYLVTRSLCFARTVGSRAQNLKTMVENKKTFPRQFCCGSCYVSGHR